MKRLLSSLILSSIIIGLLAGSANAGEPRKCRGHGTSPYKDESHNYAFWNLQQQIKEYFPNGYRTTGQLNVEYCRTTVNGQAVWNCDIDVDVEDGPIQPTKD